MLRYLLVIGGAIASILLFILASASENSAAFDQHYPWLLGLNALVAGALLILVMLLLGRLYQRYKRGEFGTKLLTRLVILFSAIGVLPGLVIYLVSVQFVSRSIETWFDVRVESALEAGLNLSRSELEAEKSDLLAKANSMAIELADLSEASQITSLSHLRDQRREQEAVIVTSSGRLVASAGTSFGMLMPDLPSASMLRQARLSHGFAKVETSDDFHGDDAAADGAEPPAKPAAKQANGSEELRIRALVLIPSGTDDFSFQGEARFLQLLEPVSSQLAVDGEALRAAYSEYQERSLGRSGLRKIYLVTLTLTLLLAIFGAIASGFLIAGELARPLLLLAEGTKAVAEGNLSPRPIIASSDELGTLTQSFNVMTHQLFDARDTLEKNRAELEHAKAFLESVLGNMSAGVMVFDDGMNLVTCNESVERILHQHDFDRYIGKPLYEVQGLRPLASAIEKAFSEQSAQSVAGNTALMKMHWQQQIEIPYSASSEDGEEKITLLARGSHLPVENGNGYIVVFDDISDVISAQRSMAWGEVARRLAHEIKNPLTPIQLSAERLQMKLRPRLEAQDAALLNKAAETIVNQVAAMKHMVDDFREYARTPPAVLSTLDLNALIEEILHLYTTGDERDIIHAVLSTSLPRVMGDATQMRQVIHNLLQNAQDAVAERSPDAPRARIDVTTEEIHYRGTDGADTAAVRITILDNGPGFSPRIIGRAFEPYVTSKARGTGLGLAIVKKIIDEHGGRIDIQNRVDGPGAKIAILLLKLAHVD